MVERMLRFPLDFHTLILLVDATVCLVGFAMGLVLWWSALLFGFYDTIDIYAVWAFG